MTDINIRGTEYSGSATEV